MGGGEVARVLEGGDLLRLDVGAAARVDGQVAARGGNLAAHIVNVLGRVERDAVRGGNARLLLGHVGVGAGIRKPVRPGHEEAGDLAAAAATATACSWQAPASSTASGVWSWLWAWLAFATPSRVATACGRTSWPSRATSVTFSMVWALMATSWPCHGARQVLEIPGRIDGDGPASRDRALEVHHRAGLRVISIQPPASMLAEAAVTLVVVVLVVLQLAPSQSQLLAVCVLVSVCGPASVIWPWALSATFWPAFTFVA